jgi:hypothetical protein
MSGLKDKSVRLVVSADVHTKRQEHTSSLEVRFLKNALLANLSDPKSKLTL